MWIPFILVAAIGAALYMNNLATARSSFREQLAVVRYKHTWIMAWLYIGTFGSFIGYSAAFPLLLKTQFPARHRQPGLPRAAGRLARAADRRAAGRPDRRRAGDVLELRGDGRSPPWASSTRWTPTRSAPS